MSENPVNFDFGGECRQDLKAKRFARELRKVGGESRPDDGGHDKGKPTLLTLFLILPLKE